MALVSSTRIVSLSRAIPSRFVILIGIFNVDSQPSSSSYLRFLISIIYNLVNYHNRSADFSSIFYVMFAILTTRTFHRWLLFRILFLFFFFERMKSLKHSFEKELGENSCESIDRAQRVGYLILLLKTSYISLLRGATTYAIRSPKTWPTFQPIRKRIGKPTPVQLDHETPYFDIPRFKIPRLRFFHDS